MTTITIHAPADHIEDYVEIVAGQIAEGYLSGYVGQGHYWESDIEAEL